MCPESDRLLTPEEVGKILGMDEQWVIRKSRDHGLRLVKVGKSLRCREGELREWINDLPQAA